MTLTALVVIATTTVIKKVVDEVFSLVKTEARPLLKVSRSEIKDAQVAKALVAITKVKTLWNIEKEVSLYDFYYPSKVEISDGIVKPIESGKGFGLLQNFVIQGTAGQGKSIFLRYLCGQELRPGTSSGRIPVFVELRRIKEQVNLQGLIAETLEKLKLPATADAWKIYGSSGKFVLMLDGFDEIAPSLVDRTVAEIEHEADLYSETLQILVTSRPDGDIQKSSKFRVCKLQGLTSADHGAFLKRICSDKIQAESLLSAIEKSSTDVKELLTTPLMMTLLVILYKSHQTIPDTVPKFYEELFDVLFYRHDHSKPGFRRQRFTNLDDSALKRLFSAFCFYVRLGGLGVLTTGQLQKCCEQAELACNLNVDALKFKSELIKTVCLLQEDGFEISFIHKSVAQYYAASFVAKSSDPFAAQFYKLAYDTTGWALELRFLCELDS